MCFGMPIFLHLTGWSFRNSDEMQIRCWAVAMFTSISNERPHFKTMLLGPTGIPALVAYLDAEYGVESTKKRSWLAAWDIAYTVKKTSSETWVVEVLMTLDICNVVLRVLRYTFHRSFRKYLLISFIQRASTRWFARSPPTLQCIRGIVQRC